MTIKNYQKSVFSVQLEDNVARIELADIVPPAKEDADDETYTRTIRITTWSGEVLEVDCESSSRGDLELVKVDQLEAVKEPESRPDEEDWLTPKTYQEKSGHE